MTKKEAIDLTDKLIADFSDLIREYLNKMDVPVVPVFRLKPTTNWEKPLSLEDMASIVDVNIDRRVYPEGIRTKSRKRYLVMKRQIICYIARVMNYPVETIGKVLNVNHATVSHAWVDVPILLKAKDPELTKTYEEILTEFNIHYNQKYGEDFPKISI